MSTADRPAPVPAVGMPTVDVSAKTVACRLEAVRSQRAELDRRAAEALQARLDTMPEAAAELAARVAECQRRRAEHRCPGRCVIRDRLSGGQAPGRIE